MPAGMDRGIPAGGRLYEHQLGIGGGLLAACTSDPFI